ncbi:unnamed protein product [Choristocarpus tenellus]
MSDLQMCRCLVRRLSDGKVSKLGRRRTDDYAENMTSRSLRSRLKDGAQGNKRTEMIRDCGRGSKEFHDRMTFPQSCDIEGDVRHPKTARGGQGTSTLTNVSEALLLPLVSLFWELISLVPLFPFLSFLVTCDYWCSDWMDLV